MNNKKQPERTNSLDDGTSDTNGYQIESHKTTTDSDGPKEDRGAPRTFANGERFGRYVIVKNLGCGAMGDVYLARDTQLERQVAIKLPKFKKAGRELATKRFYREARAAAALNHPNLCPLHDIGEIDGVPFLTMAYIEGQSLHDFLKQKQKIRQRSAAVFVRKLALALSEAHRNGIVHRDLKPSNIMINQEMEPVVMDFGIAHLDTNDGRLTDTGAIVGTPRYMSPEQVRGGEDSTETSCDIYSLGIILYELLTGRTPYEGTLLNLITMILTEEPTRPSTFRENLDPELEKITLRAIQKDASSRFATMDEFAEALSQFRRRDFAKQTDDRSTNDLKNDGRPQPFEQDLHQGKPLRGVFFALVFIGFVLLATYIAYKLSWNDPTVVTLSKHQDQPVSKNPTPPTGAEPESSGAETESSGVETESSAKEPEPAEEVTPLSPAYQDDNRGVDDREAHIATEPSSTPEDVAPPVDEEPNVPAPRSPSPAIFYVHVHPESAEIKVVGKGVKVNDKRITIANPMESSSIEISVSNSGYLTFTQTLNANEGTQEHLNIRLLRSTTPETKNAIAEMFKSLRRNHSSSEIIRRGRAQMRNSKPGVDRNEIRYAFAIALLSSVQRNAFDRELLEAAETHLKKLTKTNKGTPKPHIALVQSQLLAGNLKNAAHELSLLLAYEENQRNLGPAKLSPLIVDSVATFVEFYSRQRDQGFKKILADLERFFADNDLASIYKVSREKAKAYINRIPEFRKDEIAQLRSYEDRMGELKTLIEAEHQKINREEKAIDSGIRNMNDLKSRADREKIDLKRRLDLVSSAKNQYGPTYQRTKNEGLNLIQGLFRKYVEVQQQIASARSSVEKAKNLIKKHTKELNNLDVYLKKRRRQIERQFALPHLVDFSIEYNQILEGASFRVR